MLYIWLHIHSLFLFYSSLINSLPCSKYVNLLSVPCGLSQSVKLSFANSDNISQQRGEVKRQLERQKVEERDVEREGLTALCLRPVGGRVVSQFLAAFNWPQLPLDQCQ